MTREIKRIVIHCSASPFGCADVIRGWHTDPKPKGRGWRDIGYHYVVNNGHPQSTREYLPEWDGKLEAGRPLDQAGAHVAGHNEDTVGICLIGGTEDAKEVTFTPMQIIELMEVVTWLRGTYNISVRNVVGHRDLDPHKICPGFDVKHWITRVSI